MAKCDEGYRCDVCGEDVEAVVDSDLYLRYILGDVAPLELPRCRERHVRCHPELAQFIVDSGFDPCVCPTVFDKRHLDSEHVREQEERVTRAWCRLQEIPRLGIAIPDYPLPEVRAKWGTA